MRKEITFRGGLVEEWRTQLWHYMDYNSFTGLVNVLRIWHDLNQHSARMPESGKSRVKIRMNHLTMTSHDPVEVFCFSSPKLWFPFNPRSWFPKQRSFQILGVSCLKQGLPCPKNWDCHPVTLGVSNEQRSLYIGSVTYQGETVTVTHWGIKEHAWNPRDSLRKLLVSPYSIVSISEKLQ